jgi:hypothetical protein
MPKVNWQKVKVEVIFELTWFLHRKVWAGIDSVLLSSTKQAKVVNVNALLSKEKANIYIRHNKFMVYVVTFSSDFCRHIYSAAAQTTNVSVHLDQEILHGIKVVCNSDQRQTSEEAVYTAYFGATVRPQRSTLRSKSKRCQEINQTVGCARWGAITNVAPFLFSPSTPVLELYWSEFLPIYYNPDLDKSNQWYLPKNLGGS